MLGFFLYIWCNTKIKNMSDIRRDLNRIEELFEKYELTTVTLYAKRNQMTRKTVYNKIDKGKLKMVTFGGTNFILGKKYLYNGEIKE